MALSVQEQARADAQKILASFGKTLCVNSGSIHEGKYAIVDVPGEKKGNVKVRFY